MNREKKDKHFIKKPFYEGGPDAAKQFIKENLRYPKEAFKQRITGTVTVRYTIDHEGNVVEAHAIAGIGFGCDEEAIRVIKLLKFKVPKTRGVKVQFHQTRHIHFRLPDKSESTQVTYSIKPKSKNPEKPEKPQKPGYNYTINIS
jgi:protein TonB